MRPVFREEKKEFEAKVSNQVSSQVKTEVERIRLEIEAKTDARINAILHEKEEKAKKSKADKISEAIDAAKKVAGETGVGISVNVSGSGSGSGSIATVEQDKGKDNHGHSDVIDCPTCKSHVHKVEEDKSGMVYKCTKEGCGFVSVMVRKDSDYKCNNCSMPIKKPEDSAKMEGCPFCKGTKAVKHDWSKVWGVVKK